MSSHSIAIRQQWVPLLAVLLLGCEMQADASGEAMLNPKQPDINLPDIRLDDISPDTLLVPPDIGPIDDGSTQNALEVKEDPDYLVPPTVSNKTHLALGAGRAAWVDRQDPLGQPTIALWDYTQSQEPAPLSIPYLNNPRGLHLDTEWLFYVDDIWGSQDVFGFRLADGYWRVVAGGPGAQILGDARNGRVLYTDCSTCIAGTDSESASEVYEVNASDEGAPLRLSTNKVHDRAPVFGTTSDGSSAVAWVSNYNTLQVLANDALTSIKVDATWVQDVVLSDGRLAWRASPAIINPDSMIPSPMIINPDSMMPSDINMTNQSDGSTSLITSHIEVGPDTPILLAKHGSLMAFAEGVLGSSRERVHVYDLTVTTALTSVEEAGISSFALEADALGLTAPRPDNEGLQDVWILKL